MQPFYFPMLCWSQGFLRRKRETSKTKGKKKEDDRISTRYERGQRAESREQKELRKGGRKYMNLSYINKQGDDRAVYAKVKIRQNKDRKGKRLRLLSLF